MKLSTCTVPNLFFALLSIAYTGAKAVTMSDYVVMHSTWVQLFPQFEHKIIAPNFGGAFEILPTYPNLETL